MNKIKELLKKENENRAVLYIGIIIVILIVLGGVVNKIVIDRALGEREQQIEYSKEITACQKGCNKMRSINEINDSNVFPCLEFCNKYYGDLNGR